jgi:hypothetical protein
MVFLRYLLIIKRQAASIKQLLLFLGAQYIDLFEYGIQKDPVHWSMNRVFWVK